MYLTFRRLSLSLAGPILMAGGALAAQDAPYHFEDLGRGYPAGADGRGDVAGSREVKGEFRAHAARWRDGRMETLSDLGFGSEASAIAGPGWAAGSVSDAAGVPHVVRWSSDGARTDLGVVGTVTGLDPAGTVIGFSYDDANDVQAWQVDAQGRVARLPPLPGDTTAIAWSINHRGWIAGSSWDALDIARCVVWRDGSPVDIGMPHGAKQCHARGINDAGHVVGDVMDARYFSRAFLWRDGEWTILDTLGGYSSSATAVNEDDVVVGMSEVRPHLKGRNPFVWKKGAMTDLTRGFHPGNAVHLDEVIGIDARGPISLGANIRQPKYEAHAILLVPNQE